MQPHTDNPIALIEGRRLRDIPEVALTGFESLAKAISPRGAVVYVLQMRDGYVKCGMSTRPRGRAQSIISASHRDLTRWAVTAPVMNAKELECALLAHLGCKRREWSFRTFPRAVAFLSAASLEFDNAALAEQSAREDEAHCREFKKFWLDTFHPGHRRAS